MVQLPTLHHITFIITITNLQLVPAGSQPKETLPMIMSMVAVRNVFVFSPVCPWLVVW